MYNNVYKVLATEKILQCYPLIISIESKMTGFQKNVFPLK